MKKTLFVFAAVLTLIAALGAAGFAYAQTQAPPQPYGGMMGGSGWMGGMMNGYGQGSGPGYGHMGGMMNGTGYGPMHDDMVNSLAEALDLTPEALQARIENGEMMWDIAAGAGLSDDEITTLMQSAHNLAIEQAVAEGAITPEQAAWMNSHMQQMFTGGSGGCHGAGFPTRNGTSGPNL